MKPVWMAALRAAGMGCVPTLHAQGNTQGNAQVMWKSVTGYWAESVHTDNLVHVSCVNVLKAATNPDARACIASEVEAQSSSKKFPANGIEVDCICTDRKAGFARLGERFSRERVRSVGLLMSDIFGLHYLH